MFVKLLTKHHLELLRLKGAAEARQSLHLSKCYIVGSLMHWLILFTAFRNIDKLLFVYVSLLCVGIHYLHMRNIITLDSIPPDKID